MKDERKGCLGDQTEGRMDGRGEKERRKKLRNGKREGKETWMNGL